MTYYLLKIIVTTALVILVSEVSERSTLFGGLLASIPTVSVLAMIWLYLDTGDALRVAGLATSIFWLVIPSLALFLALPALIRSGVPFPISMVVSAGVTILCYYGMLFVLERAGIRL
jgi:hypothetical protein